MNLESWAAFGPTSALWTDEAITGLAPYLVGHHPTETLVGLGFTDGQLALAATWPLDRLPDQAAYTEPVSAWAPQCDRLYVLVYTDNDEVRYDAAEALWPEALPEHARPDEFKTIAVSAKGQCELNAFDRYADEDEEDCWAPVRWPHPVLARLAAMCWHGQLPPAQRPEAVAAPAIDDERWMRVSVNDSGPILWATYPERGFSADLMCSADEFDRVLNAIWLGDDPDTLDLAYWRTRGRERKSGTASSLAAAVAAFAAWRWNRPGQRQAAFDAIEADPDCLITRAVAGLIDADVQPDALRAAPYLTDAPGPYQGPVVPVLDVDLHEAVCTALSDALEQTPDPEGDRFAASTRTVAICGMPDRLFLRDLGDLPSVAGAQWLTDQARAVCYDLERLRGVAVLDARPDGYRNAQAVLLDGSGQRHYRWDQRERPQWSAWPTAAPDIDRRDPDRLHRLAHALHRAGIH